MTERLFPSAAVASPHYLASAAGLGVLASGGNALDAAVATNLTLAVVAPYSCGFGGDLFAIVWKDGPFAYNGSGRAPAAATLEAIREAAGSDEMPERGALPVTVPGAVEGWFTLLDRFGTRRFADLARPALRYARDGFPLTAGGAERIAAAARVFTWSPEWLAVYGAARAGGVLRQTNLARAIEALSEEGPDVFYRGAIAEAIAAHLRSAGSPMATEDLASHRGEWVQPMSATYRGVEVLELPPNTQGVTALEALQILEAVGPLPADGPERHHQLIEAVKLALADRDRFVTDPDRMDVDAERLASPAWARERASAIDPKAASDPNPGRGAQGGTVYLCTADAHGMVVSLIQSNYMGFGSGMTVPGWGINLQNRGASFSLDPAHANVIAPGKRTLHTLIPAMTLRDGRPWLAFGAMGGDGQAQIHVQLLARLVDDGMPVQAAIEGPRWFVSPGDWTVTAESRFGRGWEKALRDLGHRLRRTGEFDSLMGHASAIQVTPSGYAAGTDPRTEGGALGI